MNDDKIAEIAEIENKFLNMALTRAKTKIKWIKPSVFHAVEDDFFLHRKDTKDTRANEPGQDPRLFKQDKKHRHSSEVKKAKYTLTRKDISENLTTQYNHFKKKADYLINKREESVARLSLLNDVNNDLKSINVENEMAENALFGIKTKLENATTVLLALYNHWNGNQTRAIQEARANQQDLLQLSTETGAYLFRPNGRTKL